ncbi:MAG: DUF541 domain-containing protein [Proteobacteria bacterium]|nr:DUF541 domain-containing protein [Pseudomonadota bacterium]
MRSDIDQGGDGVGYGTGTVYRSRNTSRELATTGRKRTMADIRNTFLQGSRSMPAYAQSFGRYRTAGMTSWWHPITRGLGGFSVTVAVTAAVAYASLHLVGTSNAPSLQGSTWLGVASAAPIAPQTATASGITVTGESSVTVQPDVAYLTMGIRTEARTAREATDLNATQATAVVDALKRAGVPVGGIRTSGLSLNPIFAPRPPNDNRPPAISSYEAINQVSVTIDDITRAGEIYDAAVNAGANSAGRLLFGVRNERDVTRQALEQAASDARGKADAIASGLGIKVTGVAMASDDGAGVVRPETSDMVAPRALAASAGPPTPVQSGELTFRGRVRVTFGTSN